MWARFLWGVSRLELRLVSSHPDLAGGLRFLSDSTAAFGSFLQEDGKFWVGLVKSAKVKVVASELLDTTSVTGKTVKLTKSGKKIKAVVSLTKGKTIVLTPKQALTRGTYKVTVTSRVTDLPGNAFDARSKPGTQTLRWSFTV